MLVDYLLFITSQTYLWFIVWLLHLSDNSVTGYPDLSLLTISLIRDSNLIMLMIFTQNNDCLEDTLNNNTGQIVFYLSDWYNDDASDDKHPVINYRFGMRWTVDVLSCQ